MTGPEIGKLLAILGIEDVSPTATKHERVWAALMTKQQANQASNCIIRFISEAMAPGRFVHDAARFDALKDASNEPLSLSTRSRSWLGGCPLPADQLHRIRGRRKQYDQMIKYATAIRTRTASTEAILRRFTRNASHPTYAAMLEVGRAQKTIFVARYLRLRDLQREIEEGLNVMESSNGANSVIAYGKGGEIASNRRDEQEMFVLCLRILQSTLVYVNTLMLQDILGEPE